MSTTNQRCYETTKAGTPGCFSTYGTEYMPGNDGCKNPQLRFVIPSSAH